MSAAPPETHLESTRCALCQTPGGAEELYPATLDASSLNAAIFSARRLPDRIHFRIVRCRTCGLVRSDPVADGATLERLYRQSTFNYGQEVGDLRHTYGRLLERLNRHGAAKGALLEIGCGNGFFLEEALAQGWRDVRGVEPGGETIEAAHPDIRGRIVRDLMREGLFPAEEFDAVCLFQVLDHLPDPVAVLNACRSALKPGGLILAANHNVEAFSARLLGERSPIIDIEHTYLYSPRTMRQLFAQCGFEVCEVGPFWNRYTLRYLVRLLPLPARVKASLLRGLGTSPIGQWRFRVPLGNLVLIARKPAPAGEPRP